MNGMKKYSRNDGMDPQLSKHILQIINHYKLHTMNAIWPNNQPRYSVTYTCDTNTNIHSQIQNHSLKEWQIKLHRQLAHMHTYTNKKKMHINVEKTLENVSKATTTKQHETYNYTMKRHNYKT